MPIKIGNISAKDIYIGSTPAKEIRLGSTLIWSRAQEEVYYTLTIDASGASNLDYVSGQYQAPNSSEWVQILNADGDYHLVNQDSILLPAGSLISLSVSSMDSNPISISINNFILSENTTVYFTSVSNYTLTIDASGAINGNGDSIFDYAFGQYKAPNSSEWVQILDANGDHHLDNGESILLPAGSEISLGVNSMDYSIPISISINDFILSKDTTVYFTSEVSHYTLTVNIEGNSEAYYDGYTIYVNESEFARIDHSDTFSIPSGATVRTYNNSFGINGYGHSESIVPLPSPSFSTGDSWVMDKDYSITVVAEKNYTLTIDASGAINANGDSIFDYAFGQYRMPGSNEWIQILDAGGAYHLDNGESILLPRGSEISLAVNSMDYSIPISISINNFILSEDTTVYFTAQLMYTLTINLGEGVDYSDIWYKEPGATEWVERSKYTSLNAPAGTEFYVIAAPINGYVIDSSINLGSQSNPLTLNANTTIDITTHPVAIEQYEFNVASGGGASITSISIKIGNDVVYSRSGSNLGGTEYPIQHDGSRPIYVKVETLGYIESWTWSGSSGFTTLPSTGYDGYQILFENLKETGTLTVNMSSS